MKTLTEIGIQCNTDKATFHNYTDFYEKYFEPLRNKKLNLLEIGIDYGFSIKMWYEYFINSQIYGIDINDKTNLSNERTHIEIANQENFTEISNVFKGVEFDIIIDDGGHTVEQQINTLIGLFPRLKTGGIFIVEDLHTNITTYDINTQFTVLEMLIKIKHNEEITKDYSIYNITEKQISSLKNSIQDLIIEYRKPNQPESITSIIFKK